MLKTVLLQFCATLLATLGAGIFVGERGAVSALFGGLSYVFPNMLFVVGMSMAVENGRASGSTFFVGEFAKVAATIVILIAAQQYYRDLHWLAMCIGLFVALKTNLFALLWVKT